MFCLGGLCLGIGLKIQNLKIFIFYVFCPGSSSCNIQLHLMCTEFDDVCVLQTG